MASTHAEEPLAEDTADHDAHIYEEVMLCERMEHSQRLAVEELITTEASYVHNLQLCLSDIRAHLQKKQVRGRGVNVLGAVGLPDLSRADAEDSWEVTTCALILPAPPTAPIRQGYGLNRHYVLASYNHPKALTLHL